MGSCFSCRSSEPFDCIRVVHLSGYFEDFSEPITAGQLIGKPPKYFICPSTHLLSFRSQPLPFESHLQMGHIYFLLPYSILESESSPADLASLATRLTAIAKRGALPNKSALDSLPTSRSSRPIIVQGGPHMSASVRSWKPILEAIEERSLDH